MIEKYGPWAVVAGGSEGVGSAFAHRLADAGINLVLIARKPDPLEDTAQACRAHGVEVRTLALDLTSPGAVDRIRPPAGTGAPWSRYALRRARRSAPAP